MIYSGNKNLKMRNMYLLIQTKKRWFLLAILRSAD